MSGVGVSRGRSDQVVVVPGRILVLGVLVVLALVVSAVLLGRWSASISITQESRSGRPAPAVSGPASGGSTGSAGPLRRGDGVLTGGGLLDGSPVGSGGAVCLLARPC